MSHDWDIAQLDQRWKLNVLNNNELREKHEDFALPVGQLAVDCL